MLQAALSTGAFLNPPHPISPADLDRTWGRLPLCVLEIHPRTSVPADDRLGRFLPDVSVMKAADARLPDKCRFERRPNFEGSAFGGISETRVDAIGVVVASQLLRSSNLVCQRAPMRVIAAV